MLAYDGAHGLYIVRFSFCVTRILFAYTKIYIKVPAATFEYNTFVDSVWYEHET